MSFAVERPLWQMIGSEEVGKIWIHEEMWWDG